MNVVAHRETEPRSQSIDLRTSAFNKSLLKVSRKGLKVSIADDRGERVDFHVDLCPLLCDVIAELDTSYADEQREHKGEGYYR